MKKRYQIFSFLFILIAFVLSSCMGEGTNPTPTPEPQNVVITTSSSSVSIKDVDVVTYNFTQLFTITADDTPVEVLPSYLENTTTETPGAYYVTCTYGGKSATVAINVVATVYVVECSKTEITINQSLYNSYDYLALFKATTDGKEVSITESMIETNVSNEEGNYTYKVTNGNASKTLIVHITSDHNLEVVKSYSSFELSVTDVENFDYTTLFSLYVDGKAEQVTLDMIDATAVKNGVVGNSYEVEFHFEKGKSSINAVCSITLIEEGSLQIVATNKVIYPNSEYVDLKTLFSIHKGDKEIAVQDDMITGSIDYQNAGVNEISLTYLGITKTATVEVKQGVIINTPYGDTIKILKGTSLETYDFSHDFEVVINGILFANINRSYFDLSQVDFNQINTCTVKISIPYNDKSFGLSGVKFTYYEKTITYVVIENNYQISLSMPDVVLPKDTKKYDVLSNINLTINGRNRALTENPDWVDALTTYAKVVSNPIDFTNVGVQEVSVEVYVNGVLQTPVTVNFTVRIESDVIVTAQDGMIFSGNTIYTKDLFTIVDKGKSVEVTNDMISGKVDSFVPGNYEVSITYKGITKTASIIVLDEKMLGTYHTNLRTISTTSSSSSDEDGEEETTSPTYPIGDFILSSDGSIVYNNKEAEISQATSPTTFMMKCGYSNYYVTYENGMIYIVPENSVKLGFNNERRCMIYFNESVWSVQKHVVLNYLKSYVLESSIFSYSIDCVLVQNIKTNESFWYGMKTALVLKSSADTVYEVTFGEVKFADTFKMETNCNSSATFLDQVYEFTMSSTTVGKINLNSATSIKKYANMSFTGEIDGKPAELSADQFQGFTLFVNNEKVYSISSMNLDSQLNGSTDYNKDILFLYCYNDQDYAPMSYKFQLDVENRTFTVIQRDNYFGKYANDDMFIFLDGYGKGIISFDVKSYVVTQITYTVDNSLVTIHYVNTNPTFTHGKSATLFMDTFGNMLTVHSFDEEQYNGLTFENKAISSGIIVHISSYQVGKESDTIAKEKMLENIEITSKDGVLDSAAKKAIVDTSKVRFNTPGFYQFTITSKVGDKTVVNYYAIEVIDSIYKDNKLVASYGAGVIHPENYLEINQYGQIIFECNGVKYVGNIKIEDDLTFTAKAYNDSNAYVAITGYALADGVIVCKFGNAVSYSDYFTVGTSDVIGTPGFVLRSFTVSGNRFFVLSSSETAIGSVVEVSLDSGTSIIGTNSILKVTKDSTVTFVKINSWSDVKTGLVLADSYRGTYSLTGSENIYVDGFGSVTMEKGAYEYTLNDNVITVSFVSGGFVARLNNKDYTYEKVEVALDNSLVEGKSFKASYNFTCGGYPYTATTSFKFGKNGVVTIVSASPSHDDGEAACTDDRYDPSFASKTGVNGHYSVSGNKITITVNNETFVFTIDNVLDVTSITCIETSVQSDEHGYFSVKTLFTLE